MNGDASTNISALVIFLTCTSAMLLYTAAWALSARAPAQRRSRTTGRSAAPYWYTPTGRADERGLTSHPGKPRVVSPPL